MRKRKSEREWEWCQSVSSPSTLDKVCLVSLPSRQPTREKGLNVLRDAEPRDRDARSVDEARVQAHDVERLAAAEKHRRALGVPKVVDVGYPVREALRRQAVRDGGPPEPEIPTPVTPRVHVRQDAQDVKLQLAQEKRRLKEQELDGVAKLDQPEPGRVGALRLPREGAKRFHRVVYN